MAGGYERNLLFKHQFPRTRTAQLPSATHKVVSLTASAGNSALNKENGMGRAHNQRARQQLVVRVIDETGAKLNADAVQLENDFFLDEVCLKTQFAACSHDQLILEQATEFGTNVGGVFVNGIVDVPSLSRCH